MTHPTASRFGHGTMLLLVVLAVAQIPLRGQGGLTFARPKLRLALAEAQSIIETFRQELPPALRASTQQELEPAWQQWLQHHDTDIRRRLAQGDEDSILNFWLFGTSFTRAPPARARDLAALEGSTEKTQVFSGRMEDLLRALRSPTPNERVMFVRDYLRERGIEPTTRVGRDQVRQLLIETRERSLGEFASTDRRLAQAREAEDAAVKIITEATIFRDRGLSADTSILVNYAIESSLETLKTGGLLAANSVRRVAVIGPGLDFLNKLDGQDFYPQQTIQPFAVVDSLRRLELAARSGVQVTTFDINARVNHHILAAKARAASGTPYVVHVPLPRTEQWTPGVLAFWSRFGNHIGVPQRPLRPPDATMVDVRAIRVPPALLRTMTPRDVNVVVERLDLPADEQFDVMIATNVFVYYDAFEQALAVANAARMLRPGGFLLSNTDVPPVAPMNPSVGYLRVQYSDQHHDQVFAYQRQ